MRLMAGVVLATFCFAASALASDTTRLAAASDVVKELRDTPDKGIPENLWEKAECVAVIPSVKKAAFVFGGEYGKGVLSCRNGSGWSAPVFLQLAKGSWGAQIGAEEIDLVLLVMNRRGIDKLLKDKVSLGGDASAAAGPLGRSAAAETDAQMSAEILSYSRAQGLFAGIDLSGGVLRPDKDANVDMYGADVNLQNVLFSHHTVPAAAQAFVRTLGSEARATTGVKR
jgi:lipid-binding SYLF domain-containing protein